MTTYIRKIADLPLLLLALIVYDKIGDEWIECDETGNFPGGVALYRTFSDSEIETGLNFKKWEP